jgi:hypothetical protein
MKSMTPHGITGLETVKICGVRVVSSATKDDSEILCGKTEINCVTLDEVVF